MTAATDRSRSVLLNGLRDVVMGTTAVADADTRHRLEQSLHEATTSDQRGDFVTALHHLEAADDGVVDDETHATLRETVDSVIDHLASSNSRLTVRHEAGEAIPPRTVALYNFWRTRDVAAFEAVSYPVEVMRPVEDGVTAVDEQSFVDARRSFERAIDAAEGDVAVDTRVLASLAAHWAGDDARALDYVEEALQFESGHRIAVLLGSILSGSSSDRYRDGRLAVTAYLRTRARVPAGGSVRVRVGLGGPGDTEWGEWSTELDCLPIECLGSHTRVAFELTGPIDAFPSLDTYYLALGTIEPERSIPRTVDHVLLDGPVTGDAAESLTIGPARE